jgi:hypothetical protein
LPLAEHSAALQEAAMAHLELSHADMKPAPLVRYEIAREHSQAKQMLVMAIIAAAMIVVFAGLFLDMVR